MTKQSVTHKAIATAVFILCLLCLPSLTFAQNHDAEHAQHHDEYRNWTTPQTGVSCCDNRDCRPTRAYLSEDGWRAWSGLRWLEIPSSAVLKVRAKDGRSHLCEKDGQIFCFAPADIKS